MVGVRGGAEPLQDPRVPEEEGAGADAHERALFGGVLLLHGREGFDEGDGLAAGFEDLGAVAAGDDEHVVVFDVLVGVVVVHVGFDDDALGGGGAGLGRDDGDFEGFGGCGWKRHVSMLLD